MSFLYSGSLWSSLYCGISSLCVGLYRWLVKVSWLGKLVRCSGGWCCISSLWSAMKCPVMSYGMSIVLGWLWTACILELRAVFLVAGEFAWYVLPWNLLALVWCLVSVQVWRHLMSSCQLMFLGVRSSLESGLDLSLLLPVIGLIFTVVSELLLLYSTTDKTSTLNMKISLPWGSPREVHSVIWRREEGGGS